MSFLSDIADVLGAAFQGKSDNIILCDCNETLLNGDLSLNRDVFEFLVTAKARGYEVHLVSDRANLVQMAIEDCLQDEGLPADYFGDVELKSDYSAAFVVLDDKPETMAHVDAEHVLKPDDPRIKHLTNQLKAGQSIGLLPSAA